MNETVGRNCSWIHVFFDYSWNLTSRQMSRQTAWWACFLWSEELGCLLTVISSSGTMKMGQSHCVLCHT